MTYKEPYTEVERATALRLYKEGWGYLAISQVIGCYPSTVKKWVDKAGLKKHPGPAYPKSFRDKVIDTYVSCKHLSLDRIAKDHKVSPTTLHRWLAEAGVPTRPHRPRVVDREGILEELKKGELTRSQIADKFKCSESWVYRVQRGE